MNLQIQQIPLGQQWPTTSQAVRSQLEPLRSLDLTVPHVQTDLWNRFPEVVKSTENNTGVDAVASRCILSELANTLLLKALCNGSNPLPWIEEVQKNITPLPPTPLPDRIGALGALWTFDEGVSLTTFIENSIPHVDYLSPQDLPDVGGYVLRGQAHPLWHGAMVRVPKWYSDRTTLSLLAHEATHNHIFWENMKPGNIGNSLNALDPVFQETLATRLETLILGTSKTPLSG